MSKSERRKLVDVNVYDLASEFIDDAIHCDQPAGARSWGDAEREALATAIQAAIEDWFDYSTHADTCRRQLGACTCHMSEAQAVTTLTCGAVHPFALDETSGPVGAYVCELPAGHEGGHHARDITVPCPPISDEERAVFAEGGAGARPDEEPEKR